MKKYLSDDDFLQFKNYVISVAVQPNSDRCCIIFYKNRHLTLCCNEKTKSVFICEGLLRNEENIFKELLEQSKSCEFCELNYNAIDFYNNVIERNSICCQLNDN